MNINWKERHTYNFPTPTRFGAGVIDELGSYLKKQQIQTPLFVTDKTLSELPIFTQVIQRLKQEGLNPQVFTGIDKNPVEKNVLTGVETFFKTSSDAIIGLGGGASMDVARAICLKAYHPKNLFDYDDALGGDQYVTEKLPPFITVPTTCGTGSEVGRSSVIAENDSHKKRILFSPRLMAQIVFADPLLTMELPAKITAATGMDALCHNIEAYYAKGFSPLCDGIAKEAISLIGDSINTATHSPDLESRSKMMMAALMGATSFQKGLGIVHSLAHPLSTLFDTHHGLANAIMLSHGVRFNQEECSDKNKVICSLLGISGGTEELLKYLSDMNHNLGLATTLKEVGVDKTKIDALSHLAENDPCHGNNPRPVKFKDFQQIYQEAYE